MPYKVLMPETSVNTNISTPTVSGVMPTIKKTYKVIQPETNNIQTTQPIIPQDISPLSISERAKLSFSPEAEKSKALEQTYGKGNVKPISSENRTDLMVKKGNKWYVVDKKGFDLKELPKDIADFAGDIPEVLGSIGGGIAGGYIGHPHVGAGVGQALGSIGKQEIAKQIGMQEQPISLKQAGLSGGLGFLGSGVMSAAGFVAKEAARLTSRLAKGFPGLSTNLINKTFEKGANKVLTEETIKPEFLPTISKKVLTGVDLIDESANKSYAKVMSKVSPDMKLDLTNAFGNLRNNLIKEQLVDEVGNPRVLSKIDPTERAKVQGMFEYINKELVSSDITPKRALQIKNDVWRMYEQSNTTDTDRILLSLYNDIKQTMQKQIKGLAKANKEETIAKTFKQYLYKKIGQEEQTFGKIGIEPTPTSSLERFYKSNGAENEVLKKLDNLLPTKYKFYNDLENGILAKNWYENGYFQTALRRGVSETVARVADTPTGKVLGALGKSAVAITPPISKITSKVATPIITSKIAEKKTKLGQLSK